MPRVRDRVPVEQMGDFEFLNTYKFKLADFKRTKLMAESSMKAARRSHQNEDQLAALEWARKALVASGELQIYISELTGRLRDLKTDMKEINEEAHAYRTKMGAVEGREKKRARQVRG